MWECVSKYLYILCTCCLPAKTFPSSSAASDTDNPIRWVLPSRLHAVETVFAMSVHKSQGSEFLHTALLLPPTLNPILTRELVYTGITRAREWLTVVETKRGVLNEAVVREVKRLCQEYNLCVPGSL